MDQRPVAFIDSGVGGLPYCSAFRALAPAETVAYVADRANFPYGPRTKEELTGIVVDLIGRLRAAFDPKLVVIACNTASVTALEGARSAFPGLPIVGTVPAVKSAAVASVKRRIGVLATERTVRDPYIDVLAERFAPDCVLERLAAPELTEFVEKRYPVASPAERSRVASAYVDRFRALGVDAIVLGCTHYLYLVDEFAAAGAPDIAVYDSRTGVAKRALSLLLEADALAERFALGAGRLYVTGDRLFEDHWQDFASLFGLDFAGVPAGRP
jgi:glutamate racemase